MADAARVASFADVFRSTQNKQSVCTLALLTWVAGCDGQIKPREQSLLDQIAQAIDDAAELASVEAAMRQPSAADLELACRHLKKGKRVNSMMIANAIARFGRKGRDRVASQRNWGILVILGAMLVALLLVVFRWNR